MKFKFLFTIALAGATAMSMWAQGYKDGVEYYKADRLTDAEELLNRNLHNADTNKAEAYYYLGQIQLARYYSLKRTNEADPATYKNEAAECFRKGLEADPKNPFNYIGLGHLDLIDGNSDSAEDYFKEAEKLAKKDAGVYGAVARAYYEVNPTIYAKQMNKAISKGEKLVQKQLFSKNPEWSANDHDFYMFVGDVAFDASNGDSKKVGEACNAYENAIRVNPMASEGYIKYADKLFAIKANEQAEAVLRNLLQNNPNSALGQRELAEYLYNAGKVQEGIAEYGKLMKNPNHFKNDENRYMSLLYFVEDSQKGFDEATALLNADPNNFSARRFQYIFGHALKKPEALGMAEELLKLKSDKNLFATGDYTLIAGDLIKAGRNDEAIAVLEAGIKDYPKEPAVYKGAAAVFCYNLQQYDKAADTMAKAVELAGKDANVTDYNTLSDYAYYAAQSATDADKEKYLTISENAMKKAEADFNAAYKYYAPKRYGDLARVRKDNTLAADYYLKAIETAEAAGVTDQNKSDLATMYRFAGLIFASEKKNEQALVYLKKCLDITPDDAAVLKVYNQLNK